MIAMVAAALGSAFLLGVCAARLKLPPIVGYLLAGIAVSPFTPREMLASGVIDQGAELGVILLMFGVGLHFSFRDLMAVRRVAVPGALVQMLVTGGVGASLGRAWALSWGGALVLGISLAVASTVVLLKGLEAQDRLDSPDGHLAVGWLVVEDLAMVLVLVLLPAVAPSLGGSPPGASGDSPAGSAEMGVALAIAAAKVAAFAALMAVVGRRAVPWLLEQVARLGSRELFTLAVLVTALGIAVIASEGFGVSLALGAFFAGAVVNESELSHRAATDALPLQDAFAVLFFLSVGILFDPLVLMRSPLQVSTLVAVILLGKFLTSYTLLRLLGQPTRTALTIGASLSQIGEFSFIVAGLGVSYGLFSRDIQAMVVAAALIAITLNQPMLSVVSLLIRRADERQARAKMVVTTEFRTGDQEVPRADRHAPTASRESAGALEDPFDFTRFREHVVIVGYGRVGTTITEALQRDAARYVIVDEQERLVGGLRSRGERAVFGDATRSEVLRRAGTEHARLIVVTASEPIRARRIIEVAREVNPQIVFAVRTHSAVEQAFFEDLVRSPAASGRAIYAEHEAALSLAHFTLQTLGKSDDEADLVIEAMRNTQIQPTETFAAMHTREFRTMMGAQHTPPEVK